MNLWHLGITLQLLGIGLIQLASLIVLYSILEHQRRLSGYRYSPKEKGKAGH